MEKIAILVVCGNMYNKSIDFHSREHKKRKIFIKLKIKKDKKAYLKN